MCLSECAYIPTCFFPFLRRASSKLSVCPKHDGISRNISPISYRPHLIGLPLGLELRSLPKFNIDLSSSSSFLHSLSSALFVGWPCPILVVFFLFSIGQYILLRCVCVRAYCVVVVVSFFVWTWGILMHIYVNYYFFYVHRSLHPSLSLKLRCCAQIQYNPSPPKASTIDHISSNNDAMHKHTHTYRSIDRLIALVDIMHVWFEVSVITR